MPANVRACMRSLGPLTILSIWCSKSHKALDWCFNCIHAACCNDILFLPLPSPSLWLSLGVMPFGIWSRNSSHSRRALRFTVKDFIVSCIASRLGANQPWMVSSPILSHPSYSSCLSVSMTWIAANVMLSLAINASLCGLTLSLQRPLYVMNAWYILKPLFVEVTLRYLSL